MKAFLSMLIILGGLTVGWMNWDKISGLVTKVPSISAIIPGTSPAASTDAPATPNPASVAPNPARDAQAKAVALYPGLANPNSGLNQKFRALYQEARTNDPALLSRPDWPITLAERAVVALGGAPMPRNGTATAQVQQAKQVIVYTTSECPYCKLAKDYLTKKHVPFREINIDMSLSGKDDYDRLGGKGVPLIICGTKRLNGFSEEGIDHLLL